MRNSFQVFLSYKVIYFTDSLINRLVEFQTVQMKSNIRCDVTEEAKRTKSTQKCYLMLNMRLQNLITSFACGATGWQRRKIHHCDSRASLTSWKSHDRWLEREAGRGSPGETRVGCKRYHLGKAESRIKKAVKKKQVLDVKDITWEKQHPQLYVDKQGKRRNKKLYLDSGTHLTSW